MATWDVLGDGETALRYYERARRAAPQDARLLYETDQLSRRTGTAPAERLAALRARADLVAIRDDLTVELVHLLVTAGRPDEAAKLLAGRSFQPWEGGEGQVVAAHARTMLTLARRATAQGDHRAACRHLEEDLAPPDSLGEVRHPQDSSADLLLALGDARAAAGDPDGARSCWDAAAGRTRGAADRPPDEMTYYAALAERRLGHEDRASERLHALSAHALALAAAPATVDYFATSLPALLLLPEDPRDRQRRRAHLLSAMAALGLGQDSEAERLLQQVLAEDPADPLARDLLAASA